MAILVGFSLTTNEGILTPPNHATATLQLSGWGGHLNAQCGASALVGVYKGAMRLWATGTVNGIQNGIVVKLSGKYPFSAICGAGVSFTLSGWAGRLVASGTPESLAEVVAQLHHCTINASGTTDAIGRAYLTFAKAYPQYPHTFGSGSTAFLACKLDYTLVASGTTDRLGEVVVKLHRCTLVAHAYSDAHAEAVLVAPSMMGAPSAIVITKLSRPILLLVGTTGALTAYEAYSYTFIESQPGVTDVAATHYTNYPFDRFVRFNGLYYGVSVDGLYELNGDTFNGTPIISVLTTANTDFDTPMLKRPISLYIAGEVGADFKVTVNSAEVEDDSYIYRSIDKTGARNYRVMFGKGIKARYLSYAFTNTNGGDFVLDDITPEYATLRRTA